MKKTLNIQFGALSDPIAKQIKAQGFRFDGKQMLVFEYHSEAIIRLHLAGILTDSMMRKAEDRLFRKIKKHVQGMMKPVKP